MEIDSCFGCAFRGRSDFIPHIRNNWLCDDFTKRRTVPTHYATRTNHLGSGDSHLRSWLVETSEDGKNWREVARKEGNNQFNGPDFIAMFAVADGGEFRFIRLVNIGTSHNRRNDKLTISAWKIFGSLIGAPARDSSSSSSEEDCSDRE
jgi:hypothetical protein